MNRRIAVFAALVFLAGAVSAQSGKTSAQKTAPTAAAAPAAATAPVAAPKIEGTPTLAAARAAVAKAPPGAGFGVYLQAYALAMNLHDAIALCREFFPKAPPELRPDLAAFAGALALSAGSYGDAAGFFSAGGGAGGLGLGATLASLRPDLLLKAARCFLAAGNPSAAKKCLDLVPDAEGGRSWVQARGQTLAWLYLLDGEAEKAFILLQPLASGSGAQEVRREALFLLWVIASSPDFVEFKASTKGYDAATIAARLRAECPGSLERALVEKGVAAKPSSWLLTGLYAPAPAGKDFSLAVPDKPKDQGAEAQDGGGQLQVGWFSRKENALALAAKLQKQGFQVRTDEQKDKSGEPRWAVIVDASGDWTKTQVKLKDLGYESYFLP
ncbi:SPOR domain-containing protein [bacterium]|nr:SPOR domain-containing protein [bacterium]